MKQLIASIAIIVALIGFFVIIDRKEFSRHDDVQTVQGESSTPNRKPTVSVPEMKHVTEVKPVVETKPFETNLAETKTIETKLVETTPVDKIPTPIHPVAVPVISVEEAEKANEFAVFY